MRRRSFATSTWRTLRSMRVAVILLLTLAVASVAGSLLPQIPNSPGRVADYLRAHRFWGEFFLRAGFFDVFGSWWFGLISVLLVASLVACLVSRSRARLRAIWRPPDQARKLEGLRHIERRDVPWSPDQAIEISERALRRRHFRVARATDRPALTGERGALHDLGSLVFHWALLLLLLSVIIGKGIGYAGNAVIVEGQTWTNALANYDGQIRTGRFFSGGLAGTGIHLVGFQSEFGPTGMPVDFRSTVDLIGPRGDVVRTEVIRVNHPASFGGVSITQYGFGWAPRIEIRDGGDLVSSSEIPLSQGPSIGGMPELASPWHGFVKLPSADPPRAIEVALWPDSRAFTAALANGRPFPMLTQHRPLMTYTVWEGPIGDLSSSNLDTGGMTEAASGVIGEGQVVELVRGCVIGIGAGAAGRPCPDGAVTGLTMSFPELRQYSILHLNRDPGAPFALIAAILMLLGLLVALYTSRRRVWVRVEPRGDGAAITLGGFAFQRGMQFADEFAELVEAVSTVPHAGPTGP